MIEKPNEVKAAAEDLLVQSKKGSGIPSIVLGFAGFILVGAIAIFGTVANIFLNSHREMNIKPETVSKLADKIVDQHVTAAELEKEGFYKVNYGGAFLDGCRKDVLTDSFNSSLDNAGKADKINNCIKVKLIHLTTVPMMYHKY